MLEPTPPDPRRNWPEVVRLKALGVFILLWNVPVIFLFIWSLARLKSWHIFERVCLLEALMLGIALLATASSRRLQHALFVPQTDLALVRRRLYLGGAFWVGASIIAMFVILM